MEWLNYHHLRYFWTVLREGGIVPAAKVLGVSHPAVSTQLHQLEDQLGEPLVEKVGRKLVPTPAGRVVFRYADEIFGLGRELIDAVKGRKTGRPPTLAIGLVDAVPKAVVLRLLRPVLDLSDPLHLTCHEDTHDRLLAALALHQLDLVITDAPIPPGSPIRAYHHLLGETDITFFATRALRASLKGRFPDLLNDAPMLMPLSDLPLRRALNQWLERANVRPHVIAEFQDSALLKSFGAEGKGLFAAPTAVAKDVQKQYDVVVVGRVRDVTERFYAISMDRKVKHPALLALLGAARTGLFLGSTR